MLTFFLLQLFMFKEQLNLLDRREYILRIVDLEKLKMQMQRCWTFVSSYTSGNQTSKDPPPYTEFPANVSNIPAPASAKFSPQQRQQELSAGTPEFVGATMKAGIKVEDLKPPPVKKRRTGSPAGTPQSGPGQISSKTLTGSAEQNSGPGTGTYASPIALVDSPPQPPKKPLTVMEGQGQPMAPKPKAGKKGPTAQNKQTAQAAPSASPNKAMKAKGKKGATQQPASEDISVPEISMTPAVQAMPVQQSDVQITPQQQEETLKRKRELEDAQNDPVGFAERMFVSLLPSANDSEKQQSIQPFLGEAFSSELLSFLRQQGLSDLTNTTDISTASVSEAKVQKPKMQASALNMIFDEPMDGRGQAPSAGRWFQDTPSVAAETPELSQTSEDPTKRSPPDQESAVTPSSPEKNAASVMLQNAPSSTTKAILSSFDREYEELFKSATNSGLPTIQENGSPAGLGWSWETGPVQVS